MSDLVGLHAEAPSSAGTRELWQGFDASRRQLFVVGNEAADLDSMVSAYALASLLDSKEVEAIPVAQIPRSEFGLRRDAILLFESAGSEALTDGSPRKLRFWDDVDWQAASGLDDRRIVLTDHDRMTDKVADLFDGRVEFILDHHAKSNSHAVADEAQTEIVENLGSTCTLVAERFFAGENRPPSLEIARLLAGVILLDTRNFDEEEHKFTERDLNAFTVLTAFLPEDGLDDLKVRKKWYKQLKRARGDVSGFSVADLLRSDTKIAVVERLPGASDAAGDAAGDADGDADGGGRVAFASVPTTLAFAVEEAGGPEGLLREMRHFAASNGCEAMVCGFKRDKETHGGRKALAVAAAPGVPDDVADELVQRLSSVDGTRTLPAALQQNALFREQGVLEHGIGLQELEEFRPLLAFSIRAEISRKVLIPCARLPLADDAAAGVGAGAMPSG